MSARRNLFPDFPPEEDGLLNAVMDTIEALPNLDDVFDMEENHAMDEWESGGEPDGLSEEEEELEEESEMEDEDIPELSDISSEAESVSLLASPEHFDVFYVVNEDDSAYSTESDDDDSLSDISHDINSDGICTKCGLEWPQNQMCL